MSQKKSVENGEPHLDRLAHRFVVGLEPDLHGDPQQEGIEVAPESHRIQVRFQLAELLGALERPGEQLGAFVQQVTDEPEHRLVLGGNLGERVADQTSGRIATGNVVVVPVPDESLESGNRPVGLREYFTAALEHHPIRWNHLIG